MTYYISISGGEWKQTTWENYVHHKLAMATWPWSMNGVRLWARDAVTEGAVR